MLNKVITHHLDCVSSVCTGITDPPQRFNLKSVPLPIHSLPMPNWYLSMPPSLSHGDFGWWHARSSHTSSSATYEGWDRTRAGLIDIFAKQGPFDGVLGFSQGAILTGILCGLNAGYNATTKDTPFKFQFAIMVGGFIARDEKLSKVYEHEERYTIPSLHVYGMRDGIVAPEASKALSERFEGPVVVKHGGGHVIASSGEAGKGWEGFVKDMWERKNHVCRLASRRRS